MGDSPVQCGAGALARGGKRTVLSARVRIVFEYDVFRACSNFFFELLLPNQLWRENCGNVAIGRPDNGFSCSGIT